MTGARESRSFGSEHKEYACNQPVHGARFSDLSGLITHRVIHRFRALFGSRLKIPGYTHCLPLPRRGDRPIGEREAFVFHESVILLAHSCHLEPCKAVGARVDWMRARAPVDLLLAPFRLRYLAWSTAIAGAILFFALAQTWWGAWVLFAPFAALSLLGLHDVVQTRHSVLRSYPIAAHLRFLLEHIRPEIRQYFLEDDSTGTPFARKKRAVVYQRAKGQLDKVPFGTQLDVYDGTFEWLSHSIAATEPSSMPFRVVIGGPDCLQPYSASIFNISAMSFGALSANAVRALNKGAKLGGFAHDTGEGGLSPYHREHGGDLIWEIGSGYFGCRNGDGSFSPTRFADTARLAQVKMVEIKLSQGAKPGHGGVLPAAKVTQEISRIRGVARGEDCISPACHSAFTTPIEMLHFIAELRRLAGGKPTGFKLCVGHPWEVLAIVKAMLETNITPDF